MGLPLYSLQFTVYSFGRRFYPKRLTSVGLEPTTLRLRVSCSTDWLTVAPQCVPLLRGWEVGGGGGTLGGAPWCGSGWWWWDSGWWSVGAVWVVVGHRVPLLRGAVWVVVVVVGHRVPLQWRSVGGGGGTVRPPAPWSGGKWWWWWDTASPCSVERCGGAVWVVVVGHRVPLLRGAVWVVVVGHRVPLLRGAVWVVVVGHRVPTPILTSLHWLPINGRSDLKVLLLTYKTLHGSDPSYLKDLIVPYCPSRPLRSSGVGLLVPSALSVEQSATCNQGDGLC